MKFLVGIYEYISVQTEE